MSRPKVSIIVPVYNSEGTLTKCIESILVQSFGDFEIILINDGSNDRSLDLCKKYKGQDSRITVLTKPNGGVSSARNLGLDKAQGDWVVFVDSDDWIDKDYCKNLISVACSSLSFVITRHDFTDKHVESIKECLNLSGEERINYIIENRVLDFSGPYCKLFNREILNKNKIRFPENIHMGEDGIFLTRYLNSTKELTVLDINDYHYQDNSLSLSHRFYNFQSEYLCYRTWKKEIEELFKGKKWIDETEYKSAVWNNRIGDTFIRCILCLSRKPRYSIKNNYNNLKSISEKDWNEFSRYYSPITAQRQIVKRILSIKSLFLDLTLIQLDRILNYKS